MRFERESWRKLYIVESAEHRLLPIFSRGLRDYLLRLASDDGTILAKTRSPKLDLHLLLGARTAAEKKSVNDAFDDLIRVGYLSHDAGRLWITRFVEAQEARSPGAKRQAKWKATHRHQSASPETSPEASAGDVTGDVTGDAGGDVTNRSDETRRDENPQAPVVVSLAERARKVLANPHDGQWQQPSKWPETMAVCASWSLGMRIKLGDFVDRDSDLRAILTAFAAEEFTLEQLIAAGPLAEASEYFKKLRRPGPASFTAAVLRRLLAPERPGSPSARADNGGYGGPEEWAT